MFYKFHKIIKLVEKNNYNKVIIVHGRTFKPNTRKFNVKFFNHIYRIPLSTDLAAKNWFLASITFINDARESTLFDDGIEYCGQLNIILKNDTHPNSDHYYPIIASDKIQFLKDCILINDYVNTVKIYK